LHLYPIQDIKAIYSRIQRYNDATNSVYFWCVVDWLTLKRSHFRSLHFVRGVFGKISIWALTNLNWLKALSIETHTHDNAIFILIIVTNNLSFLNTTVNRDGDVHSMLATLRNSSIKLVSARLWSTRVWEHDSLATNVALP